jgi:hypothetical protein
LRRIDPALPLPRINGHSVTIEQNDERAANLFKREGLLQCHHHIPRIVVVGETIRGSSAQDSHSMRFGRIRIQTGPSGSFFHNVRPARIVLLLCYSCDRPSSPQPFSLPFPPAAPFGGRIEFPLWSGSLSHLKEETT